jgi:hypothetical protein
MAIVVATSSFVHRSAGTALEVLEGSQFSADAEVVQANKRKFKAMSEDDIRKSVEKARPEADRR